MSLCILEFGLDCFAYSNIMFIERTDRKCSVAQLMLYCVTVCNLLFGVENDNYSNWVFRKRTDSAVWHV